MIGITVTTSLNHISLVDHGTLKWMGISSFSVLHVNTKIFRDTTLQEKKEKKRGMRL